MFCILICRATAAQSPPASCSFRALLEEEENRLVRVEQTVAQKCRTTQGVPLTAPPVARKVSFKCSENSEPERPSGWVSSARWSCCCCFLYEWHACSGPPGGTVEVPSRSRAALLPYTNMHIIAMLNLTLQSLKSKSHFNDAFEWEPLTCQSKWLIRRHKTPFCDAVRADVRGRSWRWKK